MLLVNDVSKQIIYSRGKNATTSMAETLQALDPDWYIPKDINTFPFPYDPYRPVSYTHLTLPTNREV